MINKAYTFGKKEIELNSETYETRDYFSVYYNNIQALIKENFKYFEYISIDNNDRLEIIAYDRYGDESYADLIVMINSGNFLWMIPYEGDIQITIGEAYTSYLNLEINPTRDEAKEAWISTYGQDRAEVENDVRHEIIVPRNQYIQQVDALLSQYREDNIDE